MSARALEFVETWVSEKIEAKETLPADGDEAATKAWANECFQAALDEDIPAAEIQEAFDNLAEFIAGEIEEARDKEGRTFGRRRRRRAAFESRGRRGRRRQIRGNGAGCRWLPACKVP